MSRTLATLLALLTLLAAAAPVSARQPEGESPAASGEVIPGEVIVTYRAGMAESASRAQGLVRIQDLGTEGSVDAAPPALLSTAGRPVDEVLAELHADPSVLAAEPNYRVYLADDVPGALDAALATTVAVNDPKTGDQYSLDRMRVRDAWGYTHGATNLIAVLDTGVMGTHPDLVGRVVRGYDFVNNDTNAGDDNGHGTWVAGIIAAKVNDGYGMAGISWTDRILPVKVMTQQGLGNTADLLAGIRWSADHGADIINMSVGGFPYSQLMQDAVNYAWSKGAVLVGAAGNNRREEAFYPASFDNVVSVSATQPEDEFSNFSSYGPKVDVSAPGASVMVTNCTLCTYGDHDSWGTHMLISGTSFATPNVAGVLALIRARYPTYTPAQVVQRLISTVDDLGRAGWDNRYGHGRVNALRAVGGSPAAPARPVGDGLEANDAITVNAPRLAMGATVRPNIYPAGDVDVFTVDAPRAGRIDIRVSGVPDTRAWPWHQSGIPIDPIVELYSHTGALLSRVDNQWESGIELASVNTNGASPVIVRISNWYPNGNKRAYAITPTFVDTVRPVATIRQPVAGATGVSRFVDPVVTFSEPVSGVSATSFVLRDMATNTVVPATVTYDGASRTARLAPSARLKASALYRVEAGAAIKDAGGNALAATTATFTTGTTSFIDTAGTAFEVEIEWLYGTGITEGCTAEAFCPRAAVKREEAAAFVARALGAPTTTSDFFTDDEGSALEPEINRLAALGVTKGCASTLFCPAASMTRAQMASFLARALGLPATTSDFFADDEFSAHEDAINQLAAAGMVNGCQPGSYCPDGIVTREQMAAFLYRAFGPGS